MATYVVEAARAGESQSEIVSTSIYVIKETNWTKFTPIFIPFLVVVIDHVDDCRSLALQSFPGTL